MKVVPKMFKIPTWKFEFFVVMILSALFINFLPLLRNPEKESNGINYIDQEIVWYYALMFVISLPFFLEFVLDRFMGLFVSNYDTNTNQQTVVTALLIVSMMLSGVIIIMFNDRDVSFRFAQTFTAFCQTLAICAICYQTVIKYTNSIVHFVVILVTLGAYTLSQVTLTESTMECNGSGIPGNHMCNGNLNVALAMSTIGLIAYLYLTWRTWTPKEVIRGDTHSLYAARAMNILVSIYMFLRIIVLIIGVHSQASGERVLVFKLISHVILCSCGILLPGRVVRGTVLLLKVGLFHTF
jgi:hypothetical protein